MTVPYRTFPSNVDASALNEAPEPMSTATGTATTPPIDTNLPPVLPPPPQDVGSCVVAFCPATGFGTPCCTAAAQCGSDFGFGCIAFPADAGAGGTGAGGAAGDANTPPADVQCRSNGECTGDQVCCAEASFSTVACSATCAETQVRVGCSRPSDCPGGTVCCGTRSSNTAYTSLECVETCADAMQNIACTGDENCPQGQTCQASLILPQGFTVCR